jgi:hypothetical protein
MLLLEMRRGFGGRTLNGGACILDLIAGCCSAKRPGLHGASRAEVAASNVCLAEAK